MTELTYPHIEAFYSAQPARRRSREVDYGAFWHEADEWAGSPKWRVSYVELTGEVYAVCQHGSPMGPVIVLGLIPPDPAGPRGIYYRTADRILTGWADVAGFDLDWVRDRLQNAPARSLHSQLVQGIKGPGKPVPVQPEPDPPDHTPTPDAGPVVDFLGVPVRPEDREVGSRFPLYACCAGCPLTIRRELIAGRAEWRHYAKCQHCTQEIEQLPAPNGSWVDGTGITVCVKGLIGEPMLLHTPMPVV